MTHSPKKNCELLSCFTYAHLSSWLDLSREISWSNTECSFLKCFSVHISLETDFILVSGTLGTQQKIPASKLAKTERLFPRNREMINSNLGRNFDYSYWGFSWFFLSTFRQIPGKYLKLGLDRFLRLPLYFVMHYHPVCTICGTDSGDT